MSLKSKVERISSAMQKIVKMLKLFRECYMLEDVEKSLYI